MGFAQLIFTDIYRRDFNCSFYSVDQIPVVERLHFKSGVVLFSIGFLFELLYIPCIFALSRQHVRKSSICFEIMLLMCVYDMFTLPFTALFTSYLYMTGSMYCSHPRSILFAGQIIHGLWIGYAHVSIVLAINRCLVFMPLSEYIFNERTRRYWLCYPMCLTVGIWLFASPGTFNAVYGGWFFDPHLSYYTDATGKYNSWFQFWNNIIFCTLIPLIYTLFVIQYKLSSVERHIAMPKKEFALFVQTFVVNSTIVSSALVYTIIQYVKVPPELISLTHLAWIIVEGSPALIYLSINKTIQRALLKEFPMLRVLRRKIVDKTIIWTSGVQRNSQQEGREEEQQNRH